MSSATEPGASSATEPSASSATASGATQQAETGRRGEHVQSLARGLAVIRAFDADNPTLTLSEVARRTDLTRAAARRFLLTLVDLGYVRAHDRGFTLTPRVLELGYAYLSGLTLPQVAEPHLERLVATVGESSSVAVLDGSDIVYVARVAASRIMRVSITVGTRFPAFATSMGRVLLADVEAGDLDAHLPADGMEALTPRTITERDTLAAELARVQAQGWAVVDEELEAGLRAVAVPIRDAAGATVAAANISAHASRRPLRALQDELLPELLQTARAIEEDLHVTA